MKLILLCLINIFILLYIKKKVKKDNIYDIYFIIFTLAIPFAVNMGIHDEFMGQIETLRISYTFLTILLVFLLSMNKKYFENTKIDILFYILFVLIAFNYFSNEIYEIAKFTNLVVLYLSMYLLFVIYKRISKENKEKIVSAFSYIAIFNGILSILQYITNKKLIIGAFNQSIVYTEGLVATKRAVGLASTNNAAGNLAAILFSICMYNYLKNKKKQDLIALILTLIAGLLTLTRIAYVSIFIQILIYFIVSDWKDKDKVKAKLKAAIYISIPTLIVMFINIEKIINKLFLERGSTFSYRFFQYENVIKYLSSEIKFFDGIGIGQYRSYLWNNFQVRELDLHTQLLNVLVEQGILAFIIIIAINVIILINAHKSADSILKKAFLWSLFIGNLICTNMNPNQYYYTNNIVYFMTLYTFINMNKEKEKIVNE